MLTAREWQGLTKSFSARDDCQLSPAALIFHNEPAAHRRSELDVIKDSSMRPRKYLHQAIMRFFAIAYNSGLH